MYESPIEIIQHKIRSDISERVDDAIYTAVIRTDIHVEREELIKALKYDRDQYNNGYADGMADASPKWISVKDRFPSIDQEVLIRTEEGLYDVAQYSGADRFWMLERNPSCWVTAVGVTHWMPLPEPPKEG